MRKAARAREEGGRAEEAMQDEERRLLRLCWAGIDLVVQVQLACQASLRKAVPVSAREHAAREHPGSVGSLGANRASDESRTDERADVEEQGLADGSDRSGACRA